MLASADIMPPLPAAILEGLSSLNCGNLLPNPRLIETNAAATKSPITGITTYRRRSILMKMFANIIKHSIIKTAVNKLKRYFIIMIFLNDIDEDPMIQIPDRSRLMLGKMKRTPSVARTKLMYAKFAKATIVRQRGNTKYMGVRRREIT